MGLAPPRLFGLPLFGLLLFGLLLFGLPLPASEAQRRRKLARLLLLLLGIATGLGLLRPGGGGGLGRLLGLPDRLGALARLLLDDGAPAVGSALLTVGFSLVTLGATSLPLLLPGLPLVFLGPPLQHGLVLPLGPLLFSALLAARLRRRLGARRGGRHLGCALLGLVRPVRPVRPVGIHKSFRLDGVAIGLRLGRLGIVAALAQPEAAAAPLPGFLGLRGLLGVAILGALLKLEAAAGLLGLVRLGRPVCAAAQAEAPALLPLFLLGLRASSPPRRRRYRSRIKSRIRAAPAA